MRHEVAGGLMQLAVVFVILALSIVRAAAQGPGPQMPDPRQMSGIPLPDRELPAGTITVRVIRGSLSNPVRGVRVELRGDVQTAASTNESGRAEFTGLRPGAAVQAVVVVDGKPLESQQISVPATGGVRVMLVATDPETARRDEEDRRLAAGPAQRGTVVLGDQSRFVFELGDGGLNVFNILQILNTARVPVEPVAPITFELPEYAEQAALLEGSSPLANLGERRLDVRGPFPPGVTLVQFAYTLPYSGGDLSVRQVLPAQLAQLTVVVQKVGERMNVTSAQIAQQREMSSEGQTYILGRGPAVAAGGTVEFHFTGLPHAPMWPRNLALALAIVILAGGATLSIRRPASPAARERERLTARRDRLLDELAALEQDHRGDRLEPSIYASRRQQLIASLERLYAALDQDAAA